MLFHEGPSRILISTADADAVLRIAAAHDVEAIPIGSTAEGRLEITQGSTLLVGCDVNELKRRWETALETLLHG